MIISIVSAYVLSGPYIFSRMIKKLGRGDTLLVAGELRLYEDDASAGFSSVSETVSYRFPDKYRADTASPDSRKIVVSSFDTSVTIVNDEITSLRETVYDRYKDILLYRSSDLLEHRLKKLGVDASITSVGRFQDRLVYVVGAEYPDERFSQIMVDKKTFLPIRMILKGPAEGGIQNVLDVYYLDWEKKKKTWYPGKIQFLLNNRIVREFIMKQMVVDPSFTETIFDISLLKSMYTVKKDTIDTDPSPETVDEVKKTIDDFSRMYE